MIKRAEDLAVGDTLPDGRTVAAPPVIEGVQVRVPATWRGASAPARIYPVSRLLLVNIERKP